MKMRWVPNDELSPQTLRAQDHIKPRYFIEDAPEAGRAEYSEDPLYGEEMETFGIMEAEEVLPDATLCDALDLEDVLGRMEDYVIDQCMNSSNDQLFSIAKDHTVGQAEEALHAVLGAWARKYLHAHWYNGLDTKEVSVEPEEEE